MTTEETPRRAKGRPKKYKGRPEHGAPLLQARVDPEVWEWAHAQPEGIRALLERLIRDAMKKAPPVGEADAESGA